HAEAVGAGLRELRGNRRTALSADLVGRMMMCGRPVMVERVREERSDLVRLAALVSRGFPPRPARPIREDWLHLQGGQGRRAELPDAEALLAEELAAGRPLDGALVAAIRRTALSIR
ncbi:hypothetical protein VM98_35655, partial [Streptomyces rubellomurinus subsp. indigoferus]